MQNLNISVVQTKLFWEDIDANLKHFESKIIEIQDCDLFVLPETFSTAFSMNPKKLAKESSEKTLPWMKKMAMMKDAAILGSFIWEEDGHYYNACAVVFPDEKVNWYFKRHLFSLGDEDKVFTKGEKRLVFEYKGWRICPLICYDLRFPVFSRNTEDFDMLIYVANWPEKRNYAWQSLLKARAIENQVYLVACNRIGEDGNGVNHVGNSCIINYLGEEIGFGNEDKVYQFNLNKEPLLKFRQDFTFLADMDSFQLL
jgi:omega-amidase